MARVINGTVKLATGPSGDQSYMHTAHNLSIKTESLSRTETETARKKIDN